MTEDIVRTFGFLSLGTRLKRIGERLQADTQRILDEMEVPLQAGQYAFLAALDKLGPLTIGELAEAVGITQPGATRSVGKLTTLGMVSAKPGPDDLRERVISLTAKGRKQVKRAKHEVWPRIEAAVANLCTGVSGSLLDQLDAIEDGLNALPLAHRGAKVAAGSR